MYVPYAKMEPASLDVTLLRKGVTLPDCFQYTYMYKYIATMLDCGHWRTTNLFVVQTSEGEREREREVKSISMAERETSGPATAIRLCAVTNHWFQEQHRETTR